MLHPSASSPVASRRPLLIAGTQPRSGQQQLAQILCAYAQQHHASPAQCLTLTPPLNLAHLWPQVEALSQAARPDYPSSPPLALHPEQPSRSATQTAMRTDSAVTPAWSLVVVDEGLGDVVATETTVADLAWDWRLSVVLVVPVQPGCLGQAIAHSALARQSRCHLKGLVLACPTADTWIDRHIQADPHLFQQMTQLPVLGYLPPPTHTESPTAQCQAAAALHLERLWF